MPLILAVEPDRKQAAKIAAMARGPLHAELVVTSSAEGALAVLAERVPDLILTSQLLSPRDEAALADRLRELDGSGGIRVQTLMIPVLAGTQATRESKGGLLSRLRPARSGPATAEGCDPALFSAQITEYLERARDEREAETVELRVPVLKDPPPVASNVEAPKPEEPVWEEPAHMASDVVTPEPVEPVLEAAAYMTSEAVKPEPMEPALEAPAYMTSEVVTPEPVEPVLEAPVYMTSEVATLEAMEPVSEEPAHMTSLIGAEADTESALDAPLTVAWEELTLDDDDTAAPIELSSEMIDLDAFVSELEAEATRENGAPLHQVVEVGDTGEVAKKPAEYEPLEAILDALDPEPPIAAAPAPVVVAHPLSTHAAWPPLQGADANETDRDMVIEDFIAALHEAPRQDDPQGLWDEDEPVGDIDPDGDLWMPLPAAAQSRWPPMFGFAPVLPVLPVHASKVEAGVEEARLISPPPQPVQDEWGFFDPDRCGFNALRAKLEEIGK